MPTVVLTTEISAPRERVFDLARSIDLHQASTQQTGERAIAGVTTGLIGLGEEVTWEARHFGVWQTLRVRITACQRPDHFRDEMLRGAFAAMEHDHIFEDSGGGTQMIDHFSFRAPFGVIGRAAEAMFLTRYLRNFLLERNRHIKDIAETEKWKQYVSST